MTFLFYLKSCLIFLFIIFATKCFSESIKEKNESESKIFDLDLIVMFTEIFLVLIQNSFGEAAVCFIVWKISEYTKLFRDY